MTDTPLLHETLQLALQLSTKDRLHLIERVATSLEQEIDSTMERKSLKTGVELAAFLQANDPIDLVDPELADPVEWVKAQRTKEADRLKAAWEGES